MHPLNLKIKPYIQPFERKLAFLEIEQLTKARLEPVDAPTIESATLYRVTTDLTPIALANKVAYWELVGRENEIFTTRQVQREATVSIARNGQTLSEILDIPREKYSRLNLPNRRCLRYGSHGLHEYKGKFFPQLVRSLINVAELNSDAIVGDPMCGSGTTAVEAVLSGHTAQVLDMNPLSVFMTRTKCEILKVRPRRLQSSFLELSERLSRAKPRKRLPYTSKMEDSDQEYLNRWMSQDVLSALDTIAVAISEMRGPSLRDFFKLSQSNILRKISWQKEADLRVRKDISKSTSFREVIAHFLKEAETNAKYTAAFLKQESSSIGTVISHEGDARNVSEIWDQRCDVVITSPPYATALPYLDTDRLSLIYLDLLQRSDHRQRDQMMIGNREISEKTRRALWESFKCGDTALPQEAIAVINEIHECNAKDPSSGFRRKNLPALLYQYFKDMNATIGSIRDSLRSGSDCFIVVGDNQTTAGGKKIRIPTISLLEQISVSEGLKTVDVLPMEMLTNRQIHRRNATPSESIIWVRKDGR